MVINRYISFLPICMGNDSYQRKLQYKFHRAKGKRTIIIQSNMCTVIIIVTGHTEWHVLVAKAK